MDQLTSHRQAHPVYMVEDELRHGRLVAPFGFIPDGSDYLLLSPVRFDSDPRRALFLEWLRQESQAAVPLGHA